MREKGLPGIPTSELSLQVGSSGSLTRLRARQVHPPCLAWPRCHEDWTWAYQGHGHDVSQGTHGLPLPRDQHLILSTPSLTSPSPWLHSAAMPLPPCMVSTLQDFILGHPKAEDIAGQQEIHGASRKTSKRWWIRRRHTQTAACNCAAAGCCGCWLAVHSGHTGLCHHMQAVTGGGTAGLQGICTWKPAGGCCRRRAAGCSSSDPTQGFRGHRA
ncbi:PREDICTED: uncharacterized protein LOC105571678 [Cercocebus atys]|uniref:uncharacterized protein LOC105571678 n=1 Tax=Cercocebus atys TaxID=9531 RepID=UPI0005F3EA64|nr:PREDICTED: uncharacterized protein LOC105571678 [Cercocebus atys]